MSHLRSNSVPVATATEPAPATPAVAAPGNREIALAAFSLANLWFIRVWSELLNYRSADTYLMKVPPRPAQYLALCVDVLLLGAVFWGLGILARRYAQGRRARAAAQAALLLSLLIPFKGVVQVLLNIYSAPRSLVLEFLREWGAAGLVPVTLLGGLAVLRWRTGLYRAAFRTLLLLAAFLPVTFIQAGWKAAAYDDAGFGDLPPAPRLTAPGAQRVVWLLFDRMDQRLTFDARPPGLRLPELDALRSQSLYASRAYPPSLYTIWSVPALMVGRIVVNDSKLGPNELMIKFEDKTEAPWSRVPNLFSKARAAGFNSGVVGWYHPYCRVLGSSLAACSWHEAARQHNSDGRTFTEALVGQPRSLLEAISLSPFGQSLAARQHIRTYGEILAEAKRQATDPGLNLVFVHFPVPHEPYFYDRSTGAYTLRNSGSSGYVDALALVDRTLLELRRAMQTAGTWENTTLLVTSDHSHREAAIRIDGKMDHRIPFLVRFPGQQSEVLYDRPFNTLASHEMILAILRREIGNGAEAVRWLERHHYPPGGLANHAAR